MGNFEVIATYYYKGRKIEKVKDIWRQEFIIVDGDAKNWYVSVADAKRAINGLPTLWVPVFDEA